MLRLKNEASTTPLPKSLAFRRAIVTALSGLNPTASTRGRWGFSGGIRGPEQRYVHQLDQ